MDMVQRAEVFATGAHAGQKYGAAAEYTTHLYAVVSILTRFNISNEGLLAAAWLHDTLEDTKTEPRTIERLFGTGVLKLVQAVTNEPGANRRERHEKTYPKIRQAGDFALALKLADRIANVEASLQDLSGGKLGMYKKEHAAFRHVLYSEDLPEYSNLGRMWEHLDRLMQTPPPKRLKHTLITIGPIGMKLAYLDVSREEAIRRYTESEGEQPAPEDVTEFTFIDCFYTYEAGPITLSALATK